MTELTPEDVAHLRAAIAHPLENRPWHDWLEMTLDALAAEKARADEAEAKVSRVIAAENRAQEALAKAEQERGTLEARLFASQAAYDDLARETGVALDKAWTAKNAAEARVDELEAGINALADEECDCAGHHTCQRDDLRALTEKGAEA